MLKSGQINLDGVGIFTSTLCAIHCALLPLVAAALPLIGLDFLRRPLFEYGMIGLAFAIGSWALWHGFARHHRRLLPGILFSGGMILLIAKELWMNYELYFLPFAVGLILSAHFWNYRLTAREKKTRQAELAGFSQIRDRA
jgi:hypothetical protein